MTNGEFIKSIFPSTLNRENAIFKALLCNKDGNGTIEKIFDDLEAERLNWYKTKLYDQEGEQLDKTLDLFSVFETYYNNTDDIKRMKHELAFYRLGDKKWGSVADIKKIFEQFFEKVWIVNNTDNIDNNLISNCSFENDEVEPWSLTDCEVIKTDAFDNAKCLQLNGGTASITIDVEPSSTYFLYFFAKTKPISVTIKKTYNNQQYFWKNSSKSWEIYRELFIKRVSATFSTSSDWDNYGLYFLTDKNTTSVTIEFYSSGALLDYVRLFKKSSAITFTLIGLYNESEEISDPTLLYSLDESEKQKFLSKHHFDGDLSTENLTFYKELLNYLKASGTIGNLEIIQQKIGETNEQFTENISV